MLTKKLKIKITKCKKIKLKKQKQKHRVRKLPEGMLMDVGPFFHNCNTGSVETIIVHCQSKANGFSKTSINCGRNRRTDVSSGAV